MIKDTRPISPSWYLDEHQKENHGLMFNNNYKGSGLSRRDFFKRYLGQKINVFVLAPWENGSYINVSGDVYESCYWGIACHIFTMIPRYLETHDSASLEDRSVRLYPAEESLNRFEWLQKERLIKDGRANTDPRIERLYLVDVEFLGVYRPPQEVAAVVQGRQLEL